MSLLKRFQTLWALSKVNEEPAVLYDHTKAQGVIEIEPTPKQEVVFIPRVIKDPIKAITEEDNENN